MRSRTRNVVASTAGLLITVMIAGAAYAQTATPTSSSSGNGVLRVGVIADLGTENVFAVGAGSDYTGPTVVDDLPRGFSSTDLTAAPGLATGCDHSADYKT